MIDRGERGPAGTKVRRGVDLENRHGCAPVVSIHISLLYQLVRLSSPRITHHPSKEGMQIRETTTRRGQHTKAGAQRTSDVPWLVM